MLRAEEVVERIDASYVGRRDKRPRSYIGASAVGQECDASLAFSLRGFPDTEPSPRLQRVFELGHRIEDIVVADLKAAGLDVLDRDGLTGRQFAYEEWGGHVVCHTDGIVADSEGQRAYILEVKSMKDRLWKKFAKEGVRSSHRYYFDQVQMMMAMSEISQTLFIAYNKDTSEYHAEIVDADDLVQNYIAQRVQGIVDSGTGVKLAKDPDDWRCRGCFKRGACWEDVEPEKLCRTCAHSIPVEDGGWWCSHHKRKCATPCEIWEKFKPKERDDA